jgi:hypothetical protein
MPRTSRTVAQRLGTKQKSRRRAPRQAPETPASVERILDAVAPSTDGEVPSGVVPVASVGPSATTRTATGSLPRRGTVGAARSTGRVATARRRYAEYAAEYAYVWSDLRRITLVAGALLLLLIVLSFFVG